jgi:hypothetical protein
VEVEDGLSLPSFEPMIPGDLAVVLIGLAIPVFPGKKLLGARSSQLRMVLAGVSARSVQ